MKNLKSRLSGFLTPTEIKELKSSLEIVGDIAIVKVPDSLMSKKDMITKALMDQHKVVKTVLRQTSAVEGEFRTRKLEWMAGENKTKTLHREHKCLLSVDLAEVYFSSRLQFERMRIAKLVNPQEVIVNMFAGVGSFSIIIAKWAYPSKIYSIDINPKAIDCLKENVKLNKLEGTIIPLLGDAKQVVESNLTGKADRVLMPLPEKALEYLEAAVSALKPSGGWIHFYDFAHSAKNEDPITKIIEKVSIKMGDIKNVKFAVEGKRIVRHVGPNWHQIVLDIYVSFM
jgi:tRNA (guanine37-N1)-methyltransferase